jgi:hypothetical protein
VLSKSQPGAFIKGRVKGNAACAVISQQQVSNSRAQDIQLGALEVTNPTAAAFSARAVASSSAYGNAVATFLRVSLEIGRNRGRCTSAIVADYLLLQLSSGSSVADCLPELQEAIL